MRAGTTLRVRRSRASGRREIVLVVGPRDHGEGDRVRLRVVTDDHDPGGADGLEPTPKGAAVTEGSARLDVHALAREGLEVRRPRERSVHTR